MGRLKAIGRRLFDSSGGILAIVMRGFLTTLVFRVSNAVFTFLLSVLAARLLGLEGYGALQYVLGILSIVLVLGGLGLSPVIVKETAKGQNASDWSKPRGLFRFSIVATTLATLILAGVATAGIILFGQPGLLMLACLGSLAILLRQLVMRYVAFFNGLQRFVYASLGDFSRDLAIFLMLGTLWILPSASVVSPETVMGIRIIAALLTFILMWALMRRMVDQLPGAWHSTAPSSNYREWIATGLPLMVVILTSTIFTNADVAMIGAFLDPSAVGPYHAASRIAGLIAFTNSVLFVALSPTFARLFERKDYRAARHVLTRMVAFSAVMGLIVVTALLVYSEPLLSLFGDGFVAGQTALAILSISFLILSISGPALSFLMMSGYQNINAIVNGLAAVANLGLNFFLIPRYGIEGAAYATAVSIGASHLCLLAIALVKLNVLINNSTPTKRI